MSYINLNDIKRKSGLPDPVIAKLGDWLSSRPYNHRDFILPEYFSDDIREIDYDLARKAMYWGVKVGVLLTNYEIHCPSCGELVCVVHRQMDIPEKIECPDCSYIFNPWLHQDKIIVSFKIINK